MFNSRKGLPLDFIMYTKAESAYWYPVCLDIKDVT